MIVFDESNLGILSKLISGNNNFDKTFKDDFNNKRYQTQVHSVGYVYDKVVTLFPNEERANTQFVIDSYEPITKGSFWRGVDNLKRVFNKTSINTVGNSNTLLELDASAFFSKAIDSLIKGSSYDPNSALFWRLNSDKSYSLDSVDSSDIINFTDDYIVFIDKSKSTYEESTDDTKVNTNILTKNANRKTNSYRLITGTKRLYSKLEYVYISKNQYIEFRIEDSKLIADITNIEIAKPYVFVGVDKDTSYNSALHPFFPQANQALIQHRMFRIVEGIFGYPRIGELEMECDTCNGLKELPCNTCSDPNETITCTSCQGTGRKSQQSAFNVYTRRINPNRPEETIALPPVEFYGVGVDKLQYNAENWQKSIKLAEDAIYVLNKQESGNQQSAKSKEYDLQGMYSWLSRIGTQWYSKIQDLLDTYCSLKGYERIIIEEPMSYQILGEIEAFELLNGIIISEAPIFLKTTHLEDFITKYVSKSNPVNRIINILKQVDIFAFYSNKELKEMSNAGVIDDTLWRIHTLAYPTLMQMYSMDKEFMNKSDDEIIRLLNNKINPVQSLSLDIVEGQMTELAKSVGGTQALMSIIQNVASGIYDREAAIELISSLFGITKDKASLWLGTPGLDNVDIDEAAKII
jgi:hypothetical protein